LTASLLATFPTFHESKMPPP